jgi:hypothetical protein
LECEYLETDSTPYVKDNMAELDKIKLPIEVCDEIEKVPIAGANGMFLWVSLILEHLRNSE